MFTRLVTCLIASLGFTFPAMAAEIKVLAPNAAKESVTEAVSTFEKATGHKVQHFVVGNGSHYQTPHGWRGS